MELLIALAIIIAVAEIKDFKQTKKLQEISSAHSALYDNYRASRLEIEALKSMIAANQKNVDGVGMKVDAVIERVEELKEVSDKAEVNTATILREYELNGIPLGYQRRNPDMVEGI
jgi:CRISPR/Cas system-associated exonuclease Cas4 (RecB family)